MGSNLQTSTTVADYDNLWALVGLTLDPSRWNTEIITREIQNIDAQIADTLKANLDAVTSVTNPTVDQQTYTGKYWVSSVDMLDPPAGDGTRWKRFRQVLTLVSSTTAAPALPTPVYRYDKKTLNLFGIEEGTANAFVYEYRYLDPDRKDTFQTITATPPATYTEANRIVQTDEGTRTVTLLVLFRKVAWTNTLSGGIPIRSENIGISGELSEKDRDKVTSVRSDGVPIDSAETAVAAVSADTGTGDTYGTDSAVYREKADGEAVVLSTRVPRNTTGLTLDDTATGYILDRLSYSAWKTGASGIVVNWPNLNTADTATLVAALIAAGTLSYQGASYNLTNVQRQQTRGGLFNVIATGDNGVAETLTDVIAIGPEVMLKQVLTSIPLYAGGLRLAIWRHTLLRKVFDTQQAAIDYIDMGNGYNETPAGWGWRRAHTGGWWEEYPKLKRFAGFREVWTDLGTGDGGTHKALNKLATAATNGYYFRSDPNQSGT